MKVAALAFALAGSAAAFAPPGARPGTVGRSASASSSLAALPSPSSPSEPTRRDVLAASASSAAASLVAGLASVLSDPSPASAASFRTGPVTAQSAANKAAESWQGVYTDPNHPEGYRVIMAAGSGKATMTLSDAGGKDAETFKNVPVGVDGDELSFDFGFKGGPKGVVAKLSADKQSITFPDGNTWTKNANQYDGIYKDPNHPKGYRILRKYRGATKDIRFLVEVNDTGDAKDSKFVVGSYDSLLAIPTVAFTFYDYPGYQADTGSEARGKATNLVSYALQGGFSNDPHPDETKLVGQFSLEDKNPAFPYGTITFPDKTVWTRI